MNGWKVTAIIFIVLFVLETFFFIWIMNLGFESIDQENQCIYNVCDSERDASFIYYDVEEVCECYNNFGELTHSEYLGAKSK